jgi:hypothetical protein
MSDDDVPTAPRSAPADPQRSKRVSERFSETLSELRVEAFSADLFNAVVSVAVHGPPSAVPPARGDHAPDVETNA